MSKEDLKLQFVPTTEKIWKISIKIFISDGLIRSLLLINLTDIENSNVCQVHKLHLFATSLKGRIVTRKDVVDFGDCLVNTFQYKNFLICNPFDCDLHLQLLPSVERGEHPSLLTNNNFFRKTYTKITGKLT